MPLSDEIITDKLSLAYDGALNNLFRYHFFYLAKKNNQQRAEYKEYVQAAINDLYQSLSDLSADSALADLLKQALDCLRAAISLKDEYATQTIKYCFDDATQKVQKEFEVLQTKLTDCIGTQQQPDLVDEYLSLAPVQQIVLLLLFYNHFHDVEAVDDDVLFVVTQSILDKDYLDDVYKYIVGYLYFLYKGEVVDNHYNPIIQFEQFNTKLMQSDYILITSSDLEHHVNQIELISHQIPNYLSQYISYRLAIAGASAIISQLMDDLKTATTLLRTVHKAFGDQKSSRLQSGSANLAQVLINLGRLVKYCQQMNLLHDPSYLSFGQQFFEGIYNLAQFYHLNDAWEHPESIQKANQYALSVFDDYAFNLNYISSIKQQQFKYQTHTYHIIETVHQAIVPLLSIKDEELGSLYQLIADCNDAFSQANYLDVFLDNHAKCPYGFEAPLNLYDMASFCKINLPASTQIIAVHIGRLLAKFFEYRPPKQLIDKPKQLESLIDIYRTAFDIFRCLNQPFYMNSQFHEYIKAYKLYHKAQITVPYDQFSQYEEFIYRMFLDTDLPTNKYHWAIYQHIALVAKMADDLDRIVILDEFEQDTKIAIWHIYKFYQGWFNSILNVLALQEGHREQSLTKINNSKNYLQIIFSGLDKFVAEWGMVSGCLTGAGKYLIMEEACQQALMFYVYAELHHEHGLLSDSTSQALIVQLHKSVFRQDYEWAIDYCHYKRHGYSLDKHNPIVACEIMFADLGNNDYSDEILLNAFEQALLPSDNYIPYFLRYGINLGQFLHSACYVLQNRSFSEADKLLGKLIDKFTVPGVCSDITKQNHNLGTLLFALDKWMINSNCMNFFQEPDVEGVLSEPMQLLSIIADRCQKHQINLSQCKEGSENIITSLLKKIDYKIGILSFYSFQDETKHLDTLITLYSIIEHQVEPLLNMLFGESSKLTPLHLVSDLQKACRNMQTSFKFDCSQWKFTQPVIAFFKNKLCYTKQYIVSVMRERLLAIYDHHPPNSQITYEQVAQIIETAQLCEQVVDQQLGLVLDTPMLNLNKLIRQYQDVISFNEDELKTEQANNSNQSSKQSKKKRSNKKRKNKKSSQEKAARDTSNQVGECSSSKIVDKTNKTTGETSKPEDKVDYTDLYEPPDHLTKKDQMLSCINEETATKLESGLSEEPAELNESKSQLTRQSNPKSETPQSLGSVDCMSFWNARSSPVSPEPLLYNVKSYISKTEIPTYLLDLADYLYEASNGQVNLALTGGAVLSLCKQEPDKIRDYDCVANVESIQILYNYLLNSTDTYGVIKRAGSIELRKDSSRTLLVITYKQCKIEIGACEPMPGESPDQTFNRNMLERDLLPYALYLNLNRMFKDKTYLVQGITGSLEALDRSLIRGVLTNDMETTFQQRLQHDPIRLMRLTKLMLTFPDLKPDNDLIEAVSLANTPKVWEKFVNQGSNQQGQVGTAIENLFYKFTTESVLHSLLADPMTSVLSPLLNYDHDLLKACERPWLDHIKQASNDCYEKKVHLFHCLVSAHLLLCDKDDLKLPIVWVKPKDKRHFNYLSWQVVRKPYFTHDSLPQSQVTTPVPRDLLKNLVRQTRDILAPNVKLAQDYTQSNRITEWQDNPDVDCPNASPQHSP